MLARSGVSFRKTKRAERVRGFDQAPDFIVPDEFSPKVVIEAKITEDDRTARDKVTRVQHVAALSQKGVARKASPRFEVIACIRVSHIRMRLGTAALLGAGTRRGSDGASPSRLAPPTPDGHSR